MKLMIKHMKSMRCQIMVKIAFEKLGFKCISIDLGEAEIAEHFISAQQKEAIKLMLQLDGFDLLDVKKSVLIDKIKTVIIDMVHYKEELPKTKFSYYISEKLNYNYTYLANLFSQAEGSTIESFILCNKIEKAKELIGSNELSLTEIACKLDYSSIAHFSYQFKKITGVKPSDFKSMKVKQHTLLADGKVLSGAA